MRKIIPATGAFAEMLARDAELEDDNPLVSRGEVIPPSSEPDTPPLPRPAIPPLPWSENYTGEDKPQPEAELDPAELEQQQPLPSAAIEIPKPPWATAQSSTISSGTSRACSAP